MKRALTVFSPSTHRTPDGQTLVLSAQDGYCTVVAFDPLELGTPYQAGIVPLPAPPVVPLPASLPPSTSNTLQVLFAAKNTSATGGAGASAGATAVKREGGAETEGEPPVKKKKKAQLTYHGPLGT
jgi:chromatin assembly factor 1 subunit B